MTPTSAANRLHASEQMLPVFLVLLALVPAVAAQFGYGNQIEQLSLIERLRDPDFATGDFYIDSASAFGPRHYFTTLLAALGSVMPFTVAVHIGAALCNLLLGWVSYAAMRRLLDGSVVAAMLAAVLSVTNAGFSLGLAGYLHFDSFQPASIAIPLALAGFFLLMRDRPYLALASFTGAGLMHPLIGTEVAAIAFAAVMLARLLHDRGNRRSLVHTGLAGMIFLVLMAFAWGGGTPTGAEKLADEEFFAILAGFRAPHHYLGLGFPVRSWVEAGLFVLAAVLALANLARRRPGNIEITALWLAALATLALCLASLWFVDVAHHRLWVTAQLFRLLLLVKWIGFLALAFFIVDHGARQPLLAALAALGLVLATADAQPYVALLGVAALTAAPAITARTGLGARPVAMVVAAIFVGASLYFMRRHGADDQTVRAVLALLAGFVLVDGIRGAAAIRGVAATSVIAAIAVTVIWRDEGLFGWPALRAQFSWSDLQTDAAAIARAAEGLSPPGAVWVVPPDMETFRVLARRAVVVDFTSIPFEDMAMRDWRARIGAIYGDVPGGGFRATRAMLENYTADPGLAAAAQTYGATHAVLFSQTPWSGPILAENQTYKAVQLP